MFHNCLTIQYTKNIVSIVNNGIQAVWFESARYLKKEARKLRASLPNLPVHFFSLSSSFQYTCQTPLHLLPPSIHHKNAIS